jgi:hypothetical protein
MVMALIILVVVVVEIMAQMSGDNGTNSVIVEDSARCELDHIAIIDKPFDWAFHLDMNYDLFDLIIGNFCSSGTIDLLLILS